MKCSATGTELLKKTRATHPQPGVEVQVRQHQPLTRGERCQGKGIVFAAYFNRNVCQMVAVEASSKVINIGRVVSAISWSTALRRCQNTSR